MRLTKSTDLALRVVMRLAATDGPATATSREAAAAAPYTHVSKAVSRLRHLGVLEARLYAGAGVDDGRVWRPWRVTERVEEAAEVTTFTLRPADDGPLPPFRPGQYVSVRVPCRTGHGGSASTGLVRAPDDERAVSVKRIAGDPAGEVSTWLHEQVREGDVRTVGEPFGDVVLDEATARCRRPPRASAAPR